MANASHVSLLTGALRSDRFKQGQGHLTADPGTPQENHCCLGVACVVAMENGVELDYIDQDGLRYYLSDDCDEENEHKHKETCYSNDVELPVLVREWYGFFSTDPVLVDRYSASMLNDDKGLNFAQIADAFDAKFVSTAEPEDPSGILEP